eukprot:TRINITY_DN8911_c1_g2_i1.p1 TRINITY_DN8911_c1_g2~~TRINITY_DN8911_c1_g2_i1.p1  ORF type:complete len:499 (+),score=156.94 TRINITY_DN8911_c1_g2_i1:45-1541(+)
MFVVRRVAGQFGWLQKQARTARQWAPPSHVKQPMVRQLKDEMKEAGPVTGYAVYSASRWGNREEGEKLTEEDVEAGWKALGVEAQETFAAAAAENVLRRAAVVQKLPAEYAQLPWEALQKLVKSYSAYMFFCFAWRKEVGSSGITLVRMGEEWKALSAEDKEPYYREVADHMEARQALEDSLQAASGMPAPPARVSHHTEASNMNAPTEKVGPRNPYYVFCQKRAVELRASGRRYNLKAVAAEWRALGQLDKKPFFEEAKQNLSARRIGAGANANRPSRGSGSRGAGSSFSLYSQKRAAEMKSAGEEFSPAAVSKEWHALSRDAQRKWVAEEAPKAASGSPYFLFVQKRAVELRASGGRFSITDVAAEWRALGSEEKKTIITEAKANRVTNKRERENALESLPSAAKGSRVYRGSKTYQQARQLYRESMFYRTFTDVNWEDHYAEAIEFCQGNGRTAYVMTNETIWEEFHKLAPLELLELVEYTNERFAEQREKMLDM